MKAWMLVAITLLIAGCASAPVTGDSTSRTYDAPVNITNSGEGTVSLTINLNASSDQQTATKQDTANSPVVSPSTSASLAETGSTANATLGAAAKGLVKGVSNLFQPDNRTDNSVMTETTPVESANTEAAIVVTGEVEVVKLRPVDNRSFEWLPLTGADYGENVLFTFDNNCGSILVPDCSSSHTPNGNINDHNQIVFFCGTDFVAGSAENNGGRASIFTAPGCVSKTVTITRTK